MSTSTVAFVSAIYWTEYIVLVVDAVCYGIILGVVWGVLSAILKKL